MNTSRTVLCVLRDEQREEYAEELARLGGLGSRLVFESSPEEAIPLIRERDPHLLIVGMDLGFIEGIEFLAMATREYPNLETPLVMLPDKGDGLDPVVHARDKVTGRSSVDSVDFEGIAALIAEMSAAKPKAASGRAEGAPPGGRSQDAPARRPARAAVPPVLPKSRAAAKQGATLIAAGPGPAAKPMQAPAPPAAPAPARVRPRPVVAASRVAAAASPKPVVAASPDTAATSPRPVVAASPDTAEARPEVVSAASGAVAKDLPEVASAVSPPAAHPVPVEPVASAQKTPGPMAGGQTPLRGLFDATDASAPTASTSAAGAAALSNAAEAPSPSGAEMGGYIEVADPGPAAMLAAARRRPIWMTAAAASIAIVAVVGGGYFFIVGDSGAGAAADTRGGDTPSPRSSAGAKKPETSETRRKPGTQPEDALQAGPQKPAQGEQGAEKQAVEEREIQPEESGGGSEAATATGEQGLFLAGAPRPEELVMPLAFPAGRDTPTVTDPQRWDAIVERLQEPSDMRIVLRGHTSVLGDAEQAEGLGLLRAKRTMELLMERGMRRGRFRLRSAGFGRPIASNDTEEGRRKNRRVTVELRPTAE